MPIEMKFCQHCASLLSHRIPEGDDKLRFCCDTCDTIFYQNPNNVVGTLPIFEDSVLLCQRGIEPRKGKWTLPAGFMENGESTLQGAIRETYEEACVRVDTDDSSLYTLFNLPRINQVYLFFRASLKLPNFSPGIESLDVQLFNEEQIPWDEIAFPVVRATLKHYFEDRKTLNFPVRMFDIDYQKDQGMKIDLISQSRERKREDT